MINVKKQEKKDEIVLAALQHTNLPVFIYGKGSVAKYVSAKLKKNNVYYKAYVLDDDYFNGQDECISVSELNNQFSKYLVLKGSFASMFASEQDLREKFVNAVDIFYLSEVDNYEEITWDFFVQHKQIAKEIYNLFQDELSRKSFEAYLNSKINEDASFVLPYTTLPQYFPKRIVSSGEQLLDILNLPNNNQAWINCGAYSGDTIQLADSLGIKFKKIYAVEPDTKNIDKFKKNILQDKKFSNVNLLEIGLSDREEKLKFSSTGTSKSLLSESGDIEISLKKIDDLIPSDEVVDFINMDIEGGEYKALLGAKKTITRCRPKLAISAYHVKEDWFRLALLILEYNSDYKLYFRLHSCKAIDAVLYAV